MGHQRRRGWLRVPRVEHQGEEGFDIGEKLVRGVAVRVRKVFQLHKDTGVRGGAGLRVDKAAV
jgi:hypothetical protein